MNGFDVTARSLARNALRHGEILSSPGGAEWIGTQDGLNVQHVLDRMTFPTVADLLSSTLPAQGIGRLWRAGPFTYRETDPLAQDHHLSTAGGARLAVLAGQYLTPEAFGAVPDLDLADDTGTDNTAAFAALADFLNVNGGHVVVHGRYKITRGFAIYAGTWEFVGDSLIRNTANDGTNFWNNTCVFIGSYFGVDADDGINSEAAYDIADVVAGTDSTMQARCLDAADAGNFAPGDKVFLRSDATYANPAFVKGCHATTVRSADPVSGIVVLNDQITQDLVNAGSPATIRKYTGALPASGHAGKPSEVRLAVGVKLINAAFSSVESRHAQVVHIAAWGCDLQFRHLRGGGLVGANPVVDTRMELLDGEHTVGSLELAYHHHRVHIPYWRSRRIGQVGSWPDFQLNEYGSRCTVGFVGITSYSWAGDLGYAAVSISSRDVEIDNVEVNGSQGVLVNIGANGEYAEGCRIRKISARNGTARGIVVDCRDVWIGSATVANIPASSIAIQVNQGADLQLDSATLGHGPGSGRQYRVADLNGYETRSRIGQVDGNYSQRGAGRFGLLSSIGTGADDTLEQYVIPSDTALPGHRWTIRFVGEVSGTSGAKQVRLTLAGTPLATVALGPDETGPVQIEAVLAFAELSSGNGTFVLSGTARSATVTIPLSATKIVGGFGSGTVDALVTLVANMDPADRLDRREWSVVPQEAFAIW